MPIFDWPAFISLISNDKLLFAELLQLYASDWPKLFKSIEESLPANDFERIEHSAHRLKGMVRNFFSEETALCAGRVEEMAKEKNVTGIKIDMEKLKSQLSQLEIELKKKIESLP